MLAREEAMLEAQGVYAPVVSTLGIVYRPSATIEEVYEDYYILAPLVSSKVQGWVLPECCGRCSGFLFY
jgi:hypothetical protein